MIGLLNEILLIKGKKGLKMQKQLSQYIRHISEEKLF